MGEKLCLLLAGLCVFLLSKVVTVKHWKMYGCFLKSLHSQRFKPVHLNIDPWALPVLTLEKFEFDCVWLWCSPGLDSHVPSCIMTFLLLNLTFDILCLCPGASQPMSRLVSAQYLRFVFSHLQRSGQIRGVREMELRSRRLCHIPHVAFIIESMRACLHRERPESTALSVPRAFGELGFFFLL